VTQPRWHRASLWLCVSLLCGSGVACRAPGEPPTHPGVGEYRDIIRREAGSTRTALASATLVIDDANAAGLPGTYARVSLRSLDGDLRNVVIDLRQITPPPAAAAAQDRLAAIAQRDGVLIGRLEHDWTDRPLRRLVLGRVAHDADEIDSKLSKQLQQ
jgi:hypothetical protein